jgi:hypothetical protein
MGIMGATVSARSELSSRFSDKSSEFSDAMRLVKLAAEPRPVGDSVKEAVNRASRALGWSVSRTRDIWYGEAHRLDSREMDALRAVERRQNLRSIEADYRKNFEQLSALRARLQSRDPDFHKDDIAAIGWLVTELQNSMRR